MIAGIDLSTKAIDLVAIDEDNPARCEHLRIELYPHLWWESAQRMTAIFNLSHVPTWLFDRSVYLCGIERPYGPSRQSIASLHTILGAVLASLPVTAFEVSPADMRRELDLKGNCSKIELHHAFTGYMFGRAHGGFWYVDWPDDAKDAWCVAYAALRINERGTPTEEAA